MPDDKKPSVGFFGYVRAFVRMWRAYGKKQYRVFPWRTVAAFLVSLAYLFDPFDIIPDYIPLFGYIDDAAVFGLLVAAIRRDVGKFLEWETPLLAEGGQKMIDDQKIKP
jgi:uncharacterized membrane protein YkvA (DUF1232 family)